MSFDSFLGNPNAVETVREMLRADRLPGALLFTGPDGVGKRTLALMLAKASVCERFKDDFCGECAHCRRADDMIATASEDLAERRARKESARRLEGLVYFDLQLIAPLTRNILTDQIRLLRQIAYSRPFELPRRFFVIDEAQTIHWQAVDLLLKVMEEPPPTTTIVLVCPNGGELRPTIRSRCQRIKFSPVDDGLIAKLLEERSELPPAQRALVARLADGSVGKALHLDLAAYLQLREPWLQFLDRVSAGRAQDEDGRGAGARPTADWQGIFDATRAISGSRESFDHTLGIGYSLLRDLVAALECGERASVAHQDLIPRLRPWASKLGFRGIELLKDGLDRAYRSQVRNANQQLGLDSLAIELVASKSGDRKASGSPGR
jgi:DNA polymerase-3 subunit delta'